MPTYEYRCTKGHTFELFHSIRDESVKRCPRCRARARRVPSGGAGLLFKGSGFYITDYRSASYREKAKQEKSAATESGGKSGLPESGGKSGGAAESGGKSGGAAESGGKSGGAAESGGKS